MEKNLSQKGKINPSKTRKQEIVRREQIGTDSQQSVGNTFWLGRLGRQNKMYVVDFPNVAKQFQSQIKASEMLVAPRISECFGLGLLKFALVCYSLPWSAIVCLGLL